MVHTTDLYNSWLKRTQHIDDDCKLCGNERYTLTDPVFNDDVLKYTINACPSCNFEDLQITQQVEDIPLHKFVMVRKGKLDIEELEKVNLLTYEQYNKTVEKPN